MTKFVDVPQLKTLSPLDALKAENLTALAKKTPIRTAHFGEVLLNAGDTRKLTYYLLKGEVEFERSGAMSTSLRVGMAAAKQPLAPHLPRNCTVRAVTEVEYIVIDSDLLDVMLTWDQSGSYVVSTLAEDDEASADDWMTTLLQTQSFHKIPPANIQALFMRLQQVNTRAGQVIIQQGDAGDYFYIVAKGTCIVTRETPLNQEGIKLAELRVGDTFGEEALISGAPRNATVTMDSDGSLMRLSKEDFDALLNEPMLDWVSNEEAHNLVEAGARWLDVRLPSEFENFHSESAINVPLYFIRLKLKTLDRNKKYVVCCDTGRRSSAAAFILCEKGFDAYVLKGGLSQSESEVPMQAGG